MGQAVTGAERSSTDSSDGREWTETRLRDFWGLLCRTWGRPFAEKNGESMPALWRGLVESLTAREAYQAYQLAKQQSPQWPPCYAEFESIARRALEANQRPVYHRALPPPTRDNAVARRHLAMMGRLERGERLTREEVDSLPAILVGGVPCKPTPGE